MSHIISGISAASIREIATFLREGKTLLYPTETVYGLGCDVLNTSAVEKIFRAKGRAETKPMLVLVNSLVMLHTIVKDIPRVALQLFEKFSPGPLTVILPAAANIPSCVTAHTGTIGVRIPGSDFCLQLIEESQLQLISTSANISGEPAPASIEELIKIFSNKIDVCMNAGNLPPSAPSTIVDATSGKIVLVREGVIPKSALEYL